MLASLAIISKHMVKLRIEKALVNYFTQRTRSFKHNYGLRLHNARMFTEH